MTTKTADEYTAEAVQALEEAAALEERAQNIPQPGQYVKRWQISEVTGEYVQREVFRTHRQLVDAILEAVRELHVKATAYSTVALAMRATPTEQQPKAVEDKQRVDSGPFAPGTK